MHAKIEIAFTISYKSSNLSNKEALYENKTNILY
jgi:hypothetical protein